MAEPLIKDCMNKEHWPLNNYKGQNSRFQISPERTTLRLMMILFFSNEKCTVNRW